MYFLNGPTNKPRFVCSICPQAWRSLKISGFSCCCWVGRLLLFYCIFVVCTVEEGVFLLYAVVVMYIISFLFGAGER